MKRLANGLLLLGVIISNEALAQDTTKVKGITDVFRTTQIDLTVLNEALNRQTIASKNFIDSLTKVASTSDAAGKLKALTLKVTELEKIEKAKNDDETTSTNQKNRSWQSRNF